MDLLKYRVTEGDGEKMSRRIEAFVSRRRLPCATPRWLRVHKANVDVWWKSESIGDYKGMTYREKSQKLAYYAVLTGIDKHSHVQWKGSRQRSHHLEGAPFCSPKIISDGGTAFSPNDENFNLPKAQQNLSWIDGTSCRLHHCINDLIRVWSSRSLIGFDSNRSPLMLTEVLLVLWVVSRKIRGW